MNLRKNSDIDLAVELIDRKCHKDVYMGLRENLNKEEFDIIIINDIKNESLLFDDIENGVVIYDRRC